MNDTLLDVLKNTSAKELQQRAEEMLDRLSNKSSEISTLELSELIHRLRVHEIELQLQNEELLKTQYELRQSLKKYNELYDFAPAGHFSFTPKGAILEMNYSAAFMLGRDRSKLINKPFILFLPKEYHTVFFLHLQKVVEEKRQHICELQLCPHQGQAYFVNIISSHFCDEQGNVNKIRSEVVNIQEKKSIQVKLEKRSQELEKTNLQLQHEIIAHRETVQQLQVAKEAAEAGNRAKNTFLTNMSHEFRTPLNAIMGYAQLLRREPNIANGIVEHLDHIFDSGKRLLDMINDVLDITRIESERLTCFPEQVALTPFLIEIVKLYEYHCHNKGLTFVYDDSENANLPPLIWVDPLRLRQIITNLLSNAVKFTEAGSVSLQVRYQNKMLLLRVEDTGCGIAEEEHISIFLPFYQRHHSLANKVEGSGLGLSITRQLVEYMNGYIQLVSKPNQGSTFDVYLPLNIVTEQPPPDRASQAPVDVLPISGYQGPPYTILVIDDQDQIRLKITQILRPLGFSVQEAESSGSGIKMTRIYHPALIFIDTHIPGMDALATARALLHETALQQTVLIGMSGLTINNQQQYLDAGYRDFLSKPIQPSAILDKIAHYLSVQWLREPVSTLPDPLPLTQPSHLPVRHLNVLRNMAKAGDIGGISEYAEHLKKNHPQWNTFAKELIVLAENFHVKKLCQLLDQVEGEADNS